MFSISDVAGNVLFFVPFGYLAVLAVGRPGGGIGLTVAAAAAFAVMIEVGQLFSPGRTASALDVMANTLGALAGAWLARLRAGAAWGAGLGARARGAVAAEPALLAVGLIALTLAADAFYPFAVAIDPGTVGGSLRRGQWVPLGRPWGRFWGDVLVDHGVIPGLLAAVGRGVVVRAAPATPAGWLAWLGVTLYAVALEVGKVFFAGRAPNLDNAVVAALGAAVGVGLAAGLARSAVGQGARRAALVALAAGLLAYAALTPFRFVPRAAWVLRRLRGVRWLPLASYYGADPHVALFDLWNKLLLSGFLGFAVAAAGRPAASPVVGVALALGLEAAQLFTQTRVPSLDDVAIIGLGAWLGARVHRRLDRDRGSARPGTGGPAGGTAPGG